MKDREVTRIDSSSPATDDPQYSQHDIYFNITDAFNTIVVFVFLALLILYSTVV
jgi:hypothetical protein